MIIESMQNNLIKQISSLKQKKERDKLNLFVVEGIRFVDEIPNSWDIKEYIISQEFIEKYPNKIDEIKSKAKVYIVTDKIFNTISDTKTPQGILAICYKKTYKFSDILNKENNFLLLINELQDPGNLGTIIRVADSASVNGIILSENTVDLYNSKVLRSTMGSIFHIPILQNMNMNFVLDELKSNNIKILATHLKTTQTPYNINLKESIAVLIGNEANGLSEDIANKADILVKLPIMGRAESLNVSMATGIFLYEVVRQRLEC